MLKKRVLVLGATGFLGRRVVSHIIKMHPQCEVRIVSRHRQRAQNLWVFPRIEIMEGDVVRQGDFLNKALKDCDAVINLIGILHHSGWGKGTRLYDDTYNQDFKNAHVRLPQNIVIEAHKQFVHHIIQVSAIGADSKGPSEYLRSKGDGEKEIKNSASAWTIIRPSIIFAPDDRFTRLFRTMINISPLLCLPSLQFKMQPVFVEDVAWVIAKSLFNPHAIGQTYECGGPEPMSLGQMIKKLGAMQGRTVRLINLPQWVAHLQAKCFECLPAPLKLMTTDNLRSMTVPSVVSQSAPLPFNRVPLSLQDVLGQQHYLHYLDDLRAVARR